MKVTCIKCNKVFASEGAHIQSFKDIEHMYVCLVCSAKEKAYGV
jgi:hypothetical protein